jgi:hypothetical protein
VSRASLSLDNSHEGLAFTSVIDQVVDCCLCLGSREFQIPESKGLSFK